MNRPSTRHRSIRAVIAILIALGCTFSTPGTAAAATYAQIEGTGSTWSDLIVQQWIADVNSNGMQVVYTGGGSSKGRKDFSLKSTDFAISEIPYQGKDEQGNADTSAGREYAYLPIVAGGTAFTYQLNIGNQKVRNLRLSGDTLTKIFTNEITSWDDPAITKDNNGRSFPKLPITPVVRSDGSGTTAQFTTWMDKAHPGPWRKFFGKSGLTSYFPRKGRAVSQAGSDQVMNYIASSAGNGTIGYVEYAYPLDKDYPVVKVENAAGYFVEPTEYNTAVALTKAKINQDKSSPLYLTQILDGVYTNKDPRAYPISSYSYMIIPTGKTDTRMTTAKRQTIADFMFYSLCAGQSKAGPYGYSPLPLNLVQAGFQQLAKLKTADPKVEVTNRDVKSCNNPTFDGKNLNKNLLAEKAPQPEACDKTGAGPCGTETGQGGAKPADTPSQAPAAGGGGAQTPAAGGGATAAPGDAPTDAAAPGTDPAAGDPGVVTDDGAGTTTDTAVFASATELEASRPADNAPFGWLAVGLLVALVVLPGVYAASLRRRPGTTGARR
ncbi:MULTISPECIES: substrate-binding domain-containing protein [unclassified Nocardioides]|uniref:substrate-binding domain-containing protein n=1 Tax=unclassified Nocardioides TaxID=2615069 RepID=UPI003014FDF8